MSSLTQDVASDEVVQAAIWLQRLIRSRAAMRSFRAITTKEAIAKLRGMFIDDRARKAGADTNPLYANAVLASRNALRTDLLVVQALAHFWTNVNLAAGGSNGLNFDQYCVMSRKLYLACHSLECSHEISPGEFLATLEKDWSTDTGGASMSSGIIDEAAFNRSFFELADVYTDGVDGKEYATFLRKMANSIVDPKGATWRTDSQLLDHLHGTIPKLMHQVYMMRRRKWEDAFPEPLLRNRDLEVAFHSNGSHERLMLQRGDTRNWPRLSIEEYRRRSLAADGKERRPYVAGALSAHEASTSALSEVLSESKLLVHDVAGSRSPSRFDDLNGSRSASVQSPLLPVPPAASQSDSFGKSKQNSPPERHTVPRAACVLQHRRALPRAALPLAPRAYSSIATQKQQKINIPLRVPNSCSVHWPPLSSGILFFTGDRPWSLHGDGGGANEAASSPLKYPCSYTPTPRRPATAPLSKHPPMATDNSSSRRATPQMPRRAVQSARLTSQRSTITHSSRLHSERARFALPQRRSDASTAVSHPPTRLSVTAGPVTAALRALLRSDRSHTGR